MKYDGKIRCSGCDIWWRGLEAAHCSVCHRSFTAVSGFDRHRRNGKCLDPARLGYEIKPTVRGKVPEYTVWGAVDFREGPVNRPARQPDAVEPPGGSGHSPGRPDASR